MDLDFSPFRDRLVARRAELLAEAQATEESRRPVELDQTSVGRLSRMDAMQVQAMALETERRREQEIRRIDAALERLDESDFGLCSRCGEAIPEKRLTLDPAVPTCVKCAGR